MYMIEHDSLTSHSTTTSNAYPVPCSMNTLVGWVGGEREGNKTKQTKFYKKMWGKRNSFGRFTHVSDIPGLLSTLIFNNLPCMLGGGGAYH